VLPDRAAPIRSWRPGDQADEVLVARGAGLFLAAGHDVQRSALLVAASPAIAVGEALAYSMQAKSILRSRFVQDRH
jgi:hypothetical protein